MALRAFFFYNLIYMCDAIYCFVDGLPLFARYLQFVRRKDEFLEMGPENLL